MSLAQQHEKHMEHVAHHFVVAYTLQKRLLACADCEALIKCSKIVGGRLKRCLWYSTVVAKIYNAFRET